MTDRAKPEFLWRGWAPAVGILVTLIGVIVALAVAREVDQNANEKIVEEARIRAAALAEQTRRADVAVCRSQREGREVFVTSLRDDAEFLGPLVDSPEGREYVQRLRRRADELDLPLACEVELGLI